MQEAQPLAPSGFSSATATRTDSIIKPITTA
jgi:hypothetical protein